MEVTNQFLADLWFGVLSGFDPTTNPMTLKLAKSSFTPGLNLTTIDEASYDGYPNNSGVGGITVLSLLGGTNPNTGLPGAAFSLDGNATIQKVTGSGNLPQTLFGWALWENGSNLPLMSELFSSPIPLTNVNDTFFVPNPINFNFDPTGIFSDPDWLAP